jgi:ribonuclease-3
MNDPSSSTPVDDSLPVRESIDPDAMEKLNRCERRVEHVFRDKSLLLSALTHASGAGHRLASNERLEFLGDAILGTIVCELLFHRFPDYLEGDLTRIKSVVVSRQTCAKIGEALRLQDCLFVGKGVLTSPVVPPSLLADAFESLVAAVYLDGGMEAARRLVTEHIAPEVALAAAEDYSGNYKSYLQQLAQREFGVTPTYQLLDEQGPDHSKCFLVAALIGTKSFDPAWGRNKKEAEQRAACNALSQLSAESLPPVAD